MIRAGHICIAVLAIMAVVAPPSPGRSDDQGAKYSGILVAVDQAAATIVVEGMGPWQIKEGVTQVERRTIGVMSSASFVRIKRANGAAPSGWVGDFVESALPAWQVKPGDWVTVTMDALAKPPAATRIAVWQPSEAP